MGEASLAGEVLSQVEGEKIWFERQNINEQLHTAVWQPSEQKFPRNRLSIVYVQVAISRGEGYRPMKDNPDG